MQPHQKLWVVTLVTAGCAWGQPATGALQGRVTGDDGAELANAVVLYHRAVKRVFVGNSLLPALGETVVTRTVTADATGAFSVPGLPVASYGLCAELPGAPYLDSCKWSLADSVAVTASAVAQHNLVLKRGVLLRVHLNDPSQLLPPPASGLLARTGFIVGVIFGSGAYLAATRSAASATTRDYQIPVPAGAPLSLWLFSRDVSLADSSGSPLAGSGARIPFTAASGQDQSFNVRVSGVAPPLP